jgi:hypothetical protein
METLADIVEPDHQDTPAEAIHMDPLASQLSIEDAVMVIEEF